MIQPSIHTLPAQGNPAYYDYVTFDSVLTFHHFVEQEMTRLSSANTKVYQEMHQNARFQIQKQSDWYGTPMPEDIEDLRTHTQFLGMHLAKKVQQRIRDLLYSYLTLSKQRILPKPKLGYNSRGLGVFSFDRAAMGMYRIQPTNTDTPMRKLISQMKIELDTGNKVTTIKNVYTHFKDRQSSYPSLQLYLMAGGNANVKGDGLLYIGLACAELVEFMELRGIAVEVNVLIGSAFDNRQAMGIIRVKRYQDRLDKNQLLLISSDPRYFRYKGFKALIALANYFRRDIPHSLGKINPKIGKDFVDKITQGNGIVFEQSYALDDAVREVTQIIATTTKKIKTHEL